MPSRSSQAILVLGFLALTAAVVLAHLSPATGYELSVYSGTPGTFWVAIEIAFLCSLFVGLWPPREWSRPWAVFLGGLSTVAVTGLPLIRGYAFYGTGDPLSHMGWVRNVLQGDLALTNLIYPGLHSISIFIHTLLGVELERAMLMASGVFLVAFITFVPLTVYVVTDNREAAAIGAFSAFLLLPINNVGIHLTAFPSTMAVFFVPLALLLLIVYMTERDRTAMIQPVGLLLALATVTMVMVHPQQASNLLLVFLTTTAIVAVARRADGGSTGIRPAYGHTVFLAALLAAWGASHSRIGEAALAYSSRLVETALGTGSAGTNSIAQRTGSLSAMGASTTEIGVKLFLASAVFLLLTTALVAASLAGYTERFSERDRALPLLGLSLVPIGTVMALYMVGGLDTIYFRHLGFIMVLATILGAIGLWRAVGVARNRVGSKSLIAVGAVLLVGGLTVASLGTVYSSPYVYKASGHVTDKHLDGYSAAFANEAETVQYVGIRTGPDRFRDGVLGVTDVEPRSARRASRVPFGELDSDLTATFDGPRYLAVTNADVQRETVAFRELRYSERGFESLGTRPGVDRVVSNGGFHLYYVAD